MRQRRGWIGRVTGVTSGAGFGVGVLAGSALGQTLPAPPEVLTMLATPDRFFLTVILFAGFGGGARLLFHWDRERTWQRHLGQLGVSVFAGLLCALVAWDPLRGRPTVLLALGGAAGWLGGDIIARVSRVIVRVNFPEAPERPNPPEERDR